MSIAAGSVSEFGTEDASDIASTATSESADSVTHGRRPRVHRLGEGVGSAGEEGGAGGGGGESAEERSIPTVGSSVTSTLGEFDVLRFKNDFLEVKITHFHVLNISKSYSTCMLLVRGTPSHIIETQMMYAITLSNNLYVHVQ